MPMIWTAPEVAFTHRGVDIYLAYKDGAPLAHWYSTDASEQEDYEFDVRDLPVPAGVTLDNHSLIVAHAIDKGLLDFEDEPELDPRTVEMQVSAEGVETVTVEARALLESVDHKQLVQLAKAGWGNVTFAHQLAERLSMMDYLVAGLLAALPEGEEVRIQINADQALAFLKENHRDTYWSLLCALGQAVTVNGTVDEDLTIRKEIRTFVELTDDQRKAFVELDETGEPQLDYLGLCSDSRLIAKLHEAVRDAARERTISDADHGWEPSRPNDVRIEAKIA